MRFVCRRSLNRCESSIPAWIRSLHFAIHWWTILCQPAVGWVFWYAIRPLGWRLAVAAAHHPSLHSHWPMLAPPIAPTGLDGVYRRQMFRERADSNSNRKCIHDIWKRNKRRGDCWPNISSCAPMHQPLTHFPLSKQTDCAIARKMSSQCPRPWDYYAVCSHSIGSRPRRSWCTMGVRKVWPQPLAVYWSDARTVLGQRPRMCNHVAPNRSENLADKPTIDARHRSSAPLLSNLFSNSIPLSCLQCVDTICVHLTAACLSAERMIIDNISPSSRSLHRFRQCTEQFAVVLRVFADDLQIVDVSGWVFITFRRYHGYVVAPFGQRVRDFSIPNVMTWRTDSSQK